jgi:hypothetical protein
MERRLVPLNAVLALLTPDGAWFAELARQGFRLHGLEVEVQSVPGVIRVDVVAYRTAPDLLLLIECKQGRSLPERQTLGYANATSGALRKRASLPAELTGRGSVPTAAMWATWTEHADELATRLADLEIEAPLLAVGSGVARLTGSVPAGLEEFDLVDVDLHLPPARIRLDADSALEEFAKVLMAEVVAAESKREALLDLEVVARRLFPSWVVLSPQGRKALVDKLRKATTEILRKDFGSDLRLEGGIGVPERLRIVHSPASADPRGAPQSWQRRAREASRALGREGGRGIEEQPQLSFDDLASEQVGQPDEREASQANDAEETSDEHAGEGA